MDLMNTMYVQDETGKEVKMQILFTFEANGKSYVLFQNPEDSDGEVFASCYDDQGSLLPIETDEEWEMVEEVLGSFIEERENGNL